MKKLLAAAMIFLLNVSTGANAQTIQPIEFQSLTCVHKTRFNDDCSPVQIRGRYLKSGTDRIVFITHGSPGIDERHERYARHLNSLGISAVILEHWGSRGIRSSQENFAEAEKKGARAFNMTLDAMHGMQFFKEKNGYKFFGHIGESVGGTAATWFVKKYMYSEYQRIVGRAPMQPQAVVALYAGCYEKTESDEFVKVALANVIGSLDNNSPAALCQEWSAWANKKGANITYIELAGQHHDFDMGTPVKAYSGAENPSECARYVDLQSITWLKTGKKYSANAAGFTEFTKDCMLSGKVKPTLAGHTGNPNSGFSEWGDFFVRNLR